MAKSAIWKSGYSSWSFREFQQCSLVLRFGAVKMQPVSLILAHCLMRCLLLSLSLSLCFACLPASAADVVDNLYRADVAVADHGAAALRKAMGEAMAEVLVKVSGRRQVLQDPAMQPLLNSAKNYVQQYSYRREDEGGLRLEVEFAATLVNQNLTEAQLPLWSSTRPVVLVWIAVNDDSGRRLASADSDPELLAAVDAAFDRRGVPLVLPLHDIEDSLAITAEDVWQFDYTAIAAASERYAASNILVGQLHQIPGDRWMGEWQYLWQQDSYSSSDYGVPLAAMVRAGGDLTAEKMASRLAVEASVELAADVRVQVQGLESYADYRGALRYLADIELVEAALVEFVTGDTVVFRIQAPLQVEQLRRLIELRGRMQTPLDAQALPLDIAPATLVYQWQR